jgi:hypothetical protein
MALEAAGTGGSAAVDRLSLVLIDLDRLGDADLAGWALRLLSGSAPSLWKNLDLAARRTWWDTPAWASSARDRIGQGDPGMLALVVASFHPVGYDREAAAARLGDGWTTRPPPHTRCQLGWSPVAWVSSCETQHDRWGRIDCDC